MNSQDLIKGNWEQLKDLKPFIQEAWQQAGFEEPTEIQKMVVPKVLTGEDLIAISPTGTGKTLAYLLPGLHKLDPEKKDLQALVLAPSHELVMQIFNEVQKWTAGSKINSTALIGGVNVKKQLENLRSHPQIIVATTGRLLEIINLKKIKMHEVKTIVVDEFDVLAANEHLSSLKNIIKTTLKDRQLLFFSATQSKNIEQITADLAIKPEVVIVDKEQKLSSKVQHIYFLCEQREKIDQLRGIANSLKTKALTFINDVNRLSEIESKLKYKGITLSVLIGEANKSERKLAIERFRDGKLALLLATDVAARGLDISGLACVIHFDLPRDSKQYLHRSGRTGRMGAGGTVISIVTKKDESKLQEISKQLGIVISKKVLYRGEIIDAK